MSDERRLWGIVLLICVGSRLATAIFYIEDPDSLRFALSMIDYDVTMLQPHFPAYPVFWFLAKAIYVVIDRYALSFAVIGGLSTFTIAYYTLQIARLEIRSTTGAIVVLLLLLNPLLWLMGNRYMPDLMGVAFVLAVYAVAAERARQGALVAFVLAGLSLGVKLSYAPMLLPPLLYRLIAEGRRLRFIAAALLGVAVWLVPLVAATGWDELIASALVQTHGHFADFGGTVSTEPNLQERLLRIVEGLWADGFGLYWPGRHVLTGIAALGLLGVSLVGAKALYRHLDRSFLLSAPVVGCVVYLLWIFFFQNVVHKGRHILPLLPFLTLPIAWVFSTAWQRGRIMRLSVVAFALSFGAVTLHVVAQHTKPTAVAQVYDHLKTRETERLVVVSTSLMKYYLSSRGLQAVYIPVKDEEDLAALEDIDDAGSLVAVGSPLVGRSPANTRVFYHNPYVNRMWPELPVYEY